MCLGISLSYACMSLRLHEIFSIPSKAKKYFLHTHTILYTHTSAFHAFPPSAFVSINPSSKIARYSKNKFQACFKKAMTKLKKFLSYWRRKSTSKFGSTNLVKERRNIFFIQVKGLHNTSKAIIIGDSETKVSIISLSTKLVCPIDEKTKITPYFYKSKNIQKLF